MEKRSYRMSKRSQYVRLLLHSDRILYNKLPHIGMALKLDEVLNTHWIGYMNMHAPDLMGLVK